MHARTDGVSVAICSFNGADRLPRVLEAVNALASPGVTYEVVIIDNASTDDTYDVAQAWCKGGPARRVVREAKPGLSSARSRARLEARYNILAFLDDDNVPDTQWLRYAWLVMQDQPTVVAVGGRTVAAWPGVAAPSWFPDVEFLYACGSQAQSGGVLTDPAAFLWGAGLVLRLSAWEELVARGFTPSLTGRVGRAVTSGEDVELSLALRSLGGHLYYEPMMIVEHVMTASRATWSYVLQLERANGRASVVFDTYWAALGVQPVRSWRRRTLSAARDYVRQRMHLARHPSPEAERRVAAAHGRVTEFLRQRSRADQRLTWL